MPIVPRVYDFIEQGQTAHLVMEFIRGKDLLEIMEANDNKPFPVAAGHRVGQERSATCWRTCTRSRRR